MMNSSTSEVADVVSPEALAGLEDILAAGGAARWGWAEVRGLTSPELAIHTHAVSLALAMDPAIMATVAQGPNQAYADLYAATNQRLDALCGRLAAYLTAQGWMAWAVPSSVRSRPEIIAGDFPHKTAATRAGLGWVGRNCQLVTTDLGPWLRLGTVLTTAPLPAGRPVEKSRCGACRACVDACPAQALTGGEPWRPGMPRERILDAAACDAWKKAHYMDFHHGHNCGICTAACPFGQKTLRRAPQEQHQISL